MPKSQGIALKKRYGQHFLRNQEVVDHMIEAVGLNADSSVMEIGCGDGFLTQAILKEKIARLWVFEIDPEWARHVTDKFTDDVRLSVFEENVLDLDMQRLEPHAPWTLLANLPYQITFPILHLIQKNIHLFKEGVVMVQEEVAQKIMKTGGRNYGYTSLFFQHYFELKMLDKISPDSFYPPPKVYSRLLYFKPRDKRETIPNEAAFWKFIKSAFRQPRRTLRNNLVQVHADITKIPDDILKLRGQQLTKDDLLKLWSVINEDT
jgi:16S rRNA (adenine1518-N6/adenine1519-N6)-dimethyltransferase